MSMVTRLTRAAKQLKSLGKKKKDGGLFNNPDLETFRNHAEILSGAKEAGTKQRLYNETGMTSAWDEIKRRTKKVK